MMTETSSVQTQSKATAVPWDYFALTYLISWVCWGAAYFVARGGPPVEGQVEDLLAAAPPAMLALVLLGVFGPFAAAFVLTGSRRGKGGVAALWRSGWMVRLPAPWLLVALLLFPVIQIVVLLVSGSGISFEALTRPLALIGLVAFMYFLGGPFGEEYGWRGYALPRLLERFDALTASLVLGMFWAVWHLPLFFIPGSPQAQLPFAPWAAEVLALAILFTWLHVHVGGVVFAAILFHTTANLAPTLFRPTRETAGGWRDPMVLTSVLIVAAAMVVVFVWGPKRLRRE